MISGCIFIEKIKVVPLYFAKERKVIVRDKKILMIDDDRFVLKKNEKPIIRSIRFRSLGCYPLTAGIYSNAKTSNLIQEMYNVKTSERSGRLIDSEHHSSMEEKKEMVIFNKNSIQPLFEKLKKKNILRIFTCGSVDDGKSTLIGRLLYDSKNLSIDEEKNIKNIEKEKLKFEFSNILDGLIDEKEQKITIDVAYRYFSTKKKIIIADTPGHEQYTRNMVTGASNCDLSIIIVNIKNGVTDQTKRHLYV